MCKKKTKLQCIVEIIDELERGSKNNKNARKYKQIRRERKRKVVANISIKEWEKQLRSQFGRAEVTENENWQTEGEKQFE